MRFLGVLALLICCLSCKNDPPIAINQSEENLYFEDYEVPIFKWGYMDSRGQITIPAKFDECRNFHNGYAAVNFQGKWGIINKKGEFVIDPGYKGIWPFRDGRARVRVFEKDFGFIDEDGDLVIPADYDEAYDFSEGLAVVRIGLNYGYINPEGEVVIDLAFEQAWSFENGLARVRKFGKYGIISHDGAFVIDPIYDRITGISDSLIGVCRQRKCGFILLDGTTFIPLEYQQVTDFVNGIAGVRYDGSWFLINKSRDRISDHTYDHIRPAGSGHWVCQKRQKFCLLDPSGAPLTGFVYDQINNVVNDCAAYRIGYRWGYLDDEGNELTEPIFGLAWDFNSGIARVATYEGMNYIDTKGETVLQSPYYEARDFSEGLARVMVTD